MRQLSDEDYFSFAVPFMKEDDYMTGEETGDRLEWLKKVVLTARNRLNSARRSLKSGPMLLR